jgi:hypothetical protein
VRCLGLALSLLAASAGAEAEDFTQAPPEPIAGFVDWPSLSGELQVVEMSVGYRFYVNPARPALYTVMRYRVRPPAEGLPPTEKFLWIERPGQAAVPMRCFELQGASGGRPPAWSEIAPGTPEYTQEMQTLRAVLTLQNREMHRQLQAGR